MKLNINLHDINLHELDDRRVDINMRMIIPTYIQP